MNAPSTSVRVIVFQHGLGALDYAVPPGMTLAPGDAVMVPLGPRQIGGVVWDKERLAGREVEAARLRPVAAKLDVQPLSAPMRRLVEWVADYYVATPLSVIRMVWPSVAFLPEREVTEYRPGGPLPARMTPARTEALEKLEGRQGTVRDLSRMAGVSEAVIRGLVASGTLLPEIVSLGVGPAAPDPDFAPPKLEAAQAEAATPDGRWGHGRAASCRGCSKASPARARPKSISKPSRRRCDRAGRRSSSSPKSR